MAGLYTQLSLINLRIPSASGTGEGRRFFGLEAEEGEPRVPRALVGEFAALSVASGGSCSCPSMASWIMAVLSASLVVFEGPGLVLVVEDPLDDLIDFEGFSNVLIGVL